MYTYVYGATDAVAKWDAQSREQRRGGCGDNEGLKKERKRNEM